LDKSRETDTVTASGGAAFADVGLAAPEEEPTKAISPF
jgi:hypothetical protein